MPRKLHLKFKGITPKTSRSYRKEIHRFFQYLSAEKISLSTTASSLDAVLAEYVNVLYQNGDSLTQAGWLISGLKRFLPQLRFQLPTAQQYYQNWLRDHVAQRATPMPWLVAKALATLAWRLQYYDMALLLLLGFCFFLRSTEFLTLPVENIVVDLPSSQVILTLEQTKTSKQFQQSLVLRHATLARIVAQGLQKVPPRGPLWRHSARVFRESFTLLLQNLQLESHQFSLYSLRRGGATHAYTIGRDLNYVAMQGRWRDLRTARIYLDDARATLVKLAFTRPISHHLQSLASFWSTFR